MPGKKCPACGSELPVDAASCSFCPYSFPEEEARSDIEQIGQQQSWSPLPLMLGLSAVAVVAGLWMTIASTESVLPETKDSALKAGAARSSPAQYAQRPLELQQEPPEAASSGSQEAPKAAALPKEWKMRGVVYDLMTLAALPRCQVVFRDDSVNALAETFTDEKGRYRMILPPLEGRGYAINIHKEGYAASYLDPTMAGVPQLSREKRAALARELAGAVLSPFSLEPESVAPLVTDFYLAPADNR